MTYCNVCGKPNRSIEFRAPRSDVDPDGYEYPTDEVAIRICFQCCREINRETSGRPGERLRFYLLYEWGFLKSWWGNADAVREEIDDMLRKEGKLPKCSNCGDDHDVRTYYGHRGTFRLCWECAEGLYEKGKEKQHEDGGSGTADA